MNPLHGEPRAKQASCIESVVIHDDHQVAAFRGSCAEDEANAYLHEASLNVPLGARRTVEVLIRFANGYRHRSLHVLHFLDADAPIRVHVQRTLHAQVHPRIREKLERLLAEVEEPEAAQAKRMALWLHVQSPPRIFAQSRLQRCAHEEFHAALRYWLQGGLRAEPALKAAWQSSIALAPRDRNRAEYVAGMQWARRRCQECLQTRRRRLP